MNRNKWMIAATIVLVLAGLVVGLTSIVGAQSKRPADTIDLDGTSWILTEITGTDLSPDLVGTLIFADGKAAGSATCNRFSGSYERDGSDLSFGPLMTTMMAC